MEDKTKYGDGNLVDLEFYGTKYPYMDLKHSGLTPYLNKFRRSISSINPFAIQQVPSQQRMGLGFRYGNSFYNADVYPNGIHFHQMFPTHYDPLKDNYRPQTSWQIHDYAPGPNSTLALKADELPKGCIRTIDNYKRCAMINGKEKCGDESSDIINICPNWGFRWDEGKNQ